MQEWSCWANGIFFVGSLLWGAWPIVCQILPDDSCYLVGLGGSVAFVVCALFYLKEDYNIMCKKSGVTLAVYAGGVGQGGCVGALESLNWFAIIHVTFFLGSCAHLIASIILNFSELPSNSVKFSPISHIYFHVVASHIWIISTVCGLLMDYFDRRARNYYSSQIQFRVFPCFARDWNSPDYHVLAHLAGWGTFFRFFGSIIYAVYSWLYLFLESSSITWLWILPVVAAGNFLISTLAMFVAYKQLIKLEVTWEADREQSIQYKKDWENLVANLGENSQEDFGESSSLIPPAKKL